MKACPACRREYADHIVVCSRDGEVLVPIDDQVDSLIGRIIGGTYEVLQFLGGGGFGNVYKVRNRRLDDIEALKIIHPQHMRDREPLERFRQEAKLLRRLGSKSEYIVDLYTLEEDRTENLFYFTMEFVEGWPLTRSVVERGTFTPERAVVLMRQLCSALEVAHTSGVIHRDLKLDNVLLTGEGRDERVKVLDFGIAKVLGRGSLTSLTKGMPGTPGYAAPEQIKGLGNLIGAPTDLFASGVILYSLLTARRPWTGEPLGEPLSESGQWDLINRTLEGKPHPPRGYNAAIPMELETIILRLLEKEARRRFQSASELDVALATVLSRSRSRIPHDPGVGASTRTGRGEPRILSDSLSFGRVLSGVGVGVGVVLVIVWLIGMLSDSLTSSTSPSSGLADSTRLSWAWFRNRVNMRPGPSQDNKPIRQLYQCDSVVVINSTVGTWQKVLSHEQLGWVSSPSLYGAPDPSCPSAVVVNSIPSLNARLIALRFYEVRQFPCTKSPSQSYSNTFDSTTTRIICFKLDLTYPPPGRHLETPFHGRVYRDGTLVSDWDDTLRIESSWDGNSISSGWGPDQGWRPALYRVEFSADGNVVASGTFTVR